MWIIIESLLGLGYEAPESDGDEDDQDVHQTEAQGHPGQGGGPWLQPPGHSLGTPVPVSVPCKHSQLIYLPKLFA